MLNFLAATGPISREKKELEMRPGEKTAVPDELDPLGAVLTGLFGLRTKFVSDGLDTIALFSRITFSGISEPDGDGFIDISESFFATNWLARLVFISGGLLSAVVP